MTRRFQKPSTTRLFALLLVLALVFAACSGDDDDAGGDEGGDEATTTEAMEEEGGDDTTTTEAMEEEGDDTATTAAAEEGASGGVLEVALLDDISNFDPMAFSAVNFPVIKNLYDSLIEYTPEGEAIPNLATEWTISDDNTSVSLTLRDDVTFHSGAPLDSAAVAATLEKAADPELGKNLFSTMSIVADWETPDAQTVVVNFVNPTADKQITDLLQFLSIIDPAGIADVENTPAGSGPFMLESRNLGQDVILVANPNYWQPDQPVLDGINLTVFGDPDAASAAFESGGVDIIFNVSGREGKRLAEAGNQLIEGPGPLVQVLRLNVNNGPLQNEQFRQGLAYILNREAILEVGYAGIGVVTALPWAPNSPAADPSYNDTYAYDPAKAQELFAASGLSEAEMNDWTLMVNGGNPDSLAISQILQADLAAVGINIELDPAEGSDLTDRTLGGEFDGYFGGVGNVQKFPTRVATNSIYRTSDNPVLGDALPQEYVDAIERVNSTLGPEEEIQAAYDNLNEVLMETAFGLPTNTYQFGLMIASPAVGGITLDIDNIFVGRTITIDR